MTDTSVPQRIKSSPHGTRDIHSIGELAYELKITTRAIRFYEARGLISPQRQGGSRYYDRRDRARLMLILRGKRLGFTLEEIGEFLDLYDADPTQRTQLQHLLGKVDVAITDLERKLSDIRHTLVELNEVRDRCVEGLRPSDLAAE